MLHVLQLHNLHPQHIFNPHPAEPNNVYYDLQESSPGSQCAPSLNHRGPSLSVGCTQDQ